LQMNNTKEELVKNIMRRGLLDNKYANKVWSRGEMNGGNFNNIQKESIANIARISSVKVTKKDVKEMSDPKLRRFLEKLPKNDLLKMRKEMTNVAVPFSSNAYQIKKTLNNKVNQMNKRINEKKKIATVAGLRKAAGGKSNLVNAYYGYLKSKK
jgi:hypothetical protein